MIHLKRLQRKKFFQVKKNENELKNEIHPLKSSENLLMLSTKSTEDVQTNILESPNFFKINFLEILKNLKEISNSNETFLTTIQKNKNFNYDSDLKILHTLMAQMSNFIEN
jgi:hypothetical protein